MIMTISDLNFLLSSGSVDRGSRIEQACGEHIHKNVNTPHLTQIPTPVSAASVSWECTYDVSTSHPTPPQCPPQKNVVFAVFARKNAQKQSVPPDLRSSKRAFTDRAPTEVVQKSIDATYQLLLGFEPDFKLIPNWFQTPIFLSIQLKFSTIPKNY